MVVIAFCMAFMVLLDSVALLLHPSLYRTCMEYVEEAMGSAWMVANAFVFLGPGLPLAICVALSGGPVLSLFVGLGAIGAGTFFALAATERFAWLSAWWRSRPDNQFRMAGLAGAGIGVWMIFAVSQLPSAISKY